MDFPLPPRPHLKPEQLSPLYHLTPVYHLQIFALCHLTIETTPIYLPQTLALCHLTIETTPIYLPQTLDITDSLFHANMVPKKVGIFMKFPCASM